MTAKAVSRRLLERDPVEVAPELLNKVLSFGRCAGRIVEVEAYREDDEASHSYRGRSERNGTMFGRAGLLYVYRSYGVHWCANVVCGRAGHGAAVLVRALEPIAGLAAMRRRRPAARSDRDLCSGPGRLTEALGIVGRHDGCDLLAARGPRLLDDGTAPPAVSGRTRRIGITRAVEREWRYVVPGSAFLSRRA